MSGQYSAASGPGDAFGGLMAAKDFKALHPDIKVGWIKGDMLMKPDVGASVARQWFDLQSVDAIFGIPHSAVALAVSTVTTEKDKVLCLANTGDDTANCIKQAHEFGLPQSGVKNACIVFQDYIARSVGLNTAAGIVGAMPFYWDMNADTHAFAARFAPRYHNAYPNYFHACAYSAVWHYLKSCAAMCVAKAKVSGRATIEQMKALPVQDTLFGEGSVRADGKHIHANRVWQTKSKAESKGEWDQFKLLATIPADKAFQSMEELGCAFTKT